MSIKNALAAALFVSAPCLAMADAPTKSLAEESVNEQVIIVYKVIGTDVGSVQDDTSQYRWKRLVVSSDEVDEAIERLESDATVGDIEIAQRVYGIKPVKEIPVPSTVRGNSVDDQVYNDPKLIDQDTWKDSEEDYPGRLSIAQAQGVFDRSKRMRIGFADGGFVETGDITYEAGANLVSWERGSEFRENVLNPNCEHRHGTHAVHISAATTNNGVGMAGIVDAHVVAARALMCNGTGYLSDLADAIVWLSGEPVDGVQTLADPVDVINVSMGAVTQCSGYIQDAIDVARSKRILVITAAGNDSVDATLFSPANCEGTVTVGSNNLNGEKSGFSNYGPRVNIYATGNQVLTTNDVDDYVYVYGTSFSAPIVSGHAALIKAAEPEADESRVIRLLTGTDVDGLVGDSAQVLDRGIINSLELAKAVSGETYIARPLSHILLNEHRTNTDAYTQAAAGIDVCSLYEVDTQKLDGLSLREGEFFKVFEVPKAQDFTLANGVEVSRSQGTRVLLKNIDPSQNDYGLSVCNSDNSVCDSEIPLNLNSSKAVTGVYCS
jgi:subtilisin family serine protease